MDRMKHLNGNLLCAIDTETTGLVAGYHDIIQVAIVPLDSNLNVLKMIGDKLIMPFVYDIKPKRPENADPKALGVNNRTLADIMQHGVEPYKLADMFDEWCDSLQLAHNKKITPLGQNYQFDKNFLVDWLGEESYSHRIDYHYRDTMCAALYLNDRASFLEVAPPFPKVNLKYLASQLSIDNPKSHDALGDCLTTIAVYKKMLTMYMGN